MTVDDPDLNLLRGVFRLSPPTLCLTFPCTGRGRTFYDECDVEANEIHTVFPDVPLTGFFSGGEFGPAPENEKDAGDHTQCRIFGFTSVFSFIRFGD